MSLNKEAQYFLKPMSDNGYVMSVPADYVMFFYRA